MKTLFINYRISKSIKYRNLANKLNIMIEECK